MPPLIRVNILIFVAKQGILENPTMELMDEVYAFNKTFKMTNMAVVAHEIGHLLGAPEVIRKTKVICVKIFKIGNVGVVAHEIGHLLRAPEVQSNVIYTVHIKKIKIFTPSQPPALNPI